MSDESTLDLRERIARRFCALHKGGGRRPEVCQMGWTAADAAIEELRSGGLSVLDVLAIGLSEAAEEVP